MSLFKRNKIWWTDFSVNGVRFRLSLETTDWRQAQKNEKEKIALATAGKFAPSSQQFARLAFSEAAQRYLDSRKLELSERSLKKERQLLVYPSRFFQTISVSRITAESLLSYRESRASDGAGPAFLNMEMGAIRRILKRAKRWHIVGEDIRPLKERRQIGRALTHEEKLRLLKTSGSKPEWQSARLAMVLALNTTMRGCELKGLRWCDVNLIDRVLTVRRSTTKTDAGERSIPINANAMNALVELYRRAQGSGGPQPQHYVFPACENESVDPTRPQKSWRTAWRRLTRAIYCPTCNELQQPGEICRNASCRASIRGIKSPLAGLRFHDLRHHAITELAESQASDQTIMSIAGHVSARMLAHYSHVRMEAKRKALDALAALGSEDGYGTSDVTIPPGVSTPRAQVIEMKRRNGRPVRIRTVDLYRVKVAL